MLADDSLYRFGASHSSLLPHEGCDSAQRKACHSGDLPEDGRPHAVLYSELVHDSEVLLLLVPHVLAHTRQSIRFCTGVRKVVCRPESKAQ